VTDKRDVPVHRGAVLNMRASAGRNVPTTITSAPAFWRAACRRHIGLGRVDIGLINNVGTIFLNRGDAYRGHHRPVVSPITAIFLP
jgi:hypothetical protein